MSDDNNYDYDKPDSGLFGISGGVAFDKNWRWDIGYQYWSKIKANATEIELDISLIESALRYDWYISDNTSIYGRLGFSYWTIDKQNLSGNNTDASGLSPLSELGISYSLSQNISINTGYQYIDEIGSYNTGKFDSHSFVVGISYSFVKNKNYVPIITNKKPVSIPVYKKTIVEKPESSQVTFALNNNTLTNNAKSLLEEPLSILKEDLRTTVLIVGHTDSSGSEYHNQKLSVRRAQSCADFFIKNGIDVQRISIKGKGEIMPFTSNKTKEGRSKNRRVEIVISKNKESF
ncbi:OmpA family protein [Aliivibrio sp. SR45-2]|nr:OmpA family protein [Aliivibrio sp. SR45-2]